MSGRFLRCGWILLIVAVAVLTFAAATSGAESALTPAPVHEARDPRSAGIAPGQVGSPLLVLVSVIALGLATALGTLVIARLTRRG
jgi:hypothetical protein